MEAPGDFNPDEWEIVDDDGFVYKRKKRRLDPAQLARPADPDPDPATEARRRRERKRRALLKLRAKYQEEISRWEHMSNTLKAMEERARQQLDEQVGAGPQERECVGLQDPVESIEHPPGSLIDDLALMVEAEDAMLHDLSHLCDAVDSFCDAREEKKRRYFLDLPIWDSPRELMSSLCQD